MILEWISLKILRPGGNETASHYSIQSPTGVQVLERMEEVVDEEN